MVQCNDAACLWMQLHGLQHEIHTSISEADQAVTSVSECIIPASLMGPHEVPALSERAV